MPQSTLITGGAGSIGRALAESFVRAGHDTYVLDIAPEVEEVAASVGARGLRADLTDAASVAKAVGGLASLDTLVTAVGTWPQLLIDELSVEEWNRQIAINLSSVYVAVKCVLPALRAARGCIVNFASAAALTGFEQMIAYCTSKAGVLGLTRSLAVALGPDGIRVNSVLPGAMDTASNTVLGTEALEEARLSRALKRPGTPEDLVGAVHFLASPAAAFITGQSLVVDGGSLFL